MKVLVIGAGLGGLGLARQLQRAGITFGVRERDTGVQTRFQGYRVGIGGAGLAALQDCLPDRLQPLLHAIGGDIAGMGRAVDSQLNLLSTYPPQVEDTVFDRHVLRHLLMAGLENHIQFGRQFEEYIELPDGTVRVRYADGTTEVADVVVGADGMGSAVRRQLAPSVRVRALGKVGAIGRTPLSDRFATLVPGWSTMVNSPDRQLVLGKMLFRRPPQQAAAELASDVHLPATPSYLRWVMLIPTDQAPQLLGDASARERDPDAGMAVLRNLVSGWHEDLRALIDEADWANSGIGPLRGSDPVTPWPTRPVTLLGDAAHPAPPGGLGANLAFVDAAQLNEKLIAAREGQVGLIDALAEYEHQMCAYAAEGLATATSTFTWFDKLREQAP